MRHPLTPHKHRLRWGSAGTLFVSEQAFKVSLHELVPGPSLELRQLAELPSPEPETEDKQNHAVTAFWAPHGQAVLLQYMIRDYSDTRGEHNANAWFEVGPREITACSLHSFLQSVKHACMHIARSHACQGFYFFMQVLYLLDVATQEFKHVVTTYDILTMVAVRWSSDGHILVLWEDYTEEGWRFDVYVNSSSASCARLSTFQPAGNDHPPSTGFLPQDRLAVASPSSFEAFSLLSGQSGGCKSPPYIQTWSSDQMAGLVTVNAPGTRLAFLPAACSDVFLFDSGTLTAVGTVRLAAYDLPPGHKAHGLVWGPYSWVVTHCHHSEAAAQHARCLRVFRQQAGSSTCTQVLKCEGQLDQEPACSPDGAFLAACHADGASTSIKVHDQRSGKLVFTQAISLPEDVQHQQGDHRRRAIWWNSSGSRILVRISNWRCGSNSDHILVLNF